jgi:hypothetical protein
LSADLSGVAQAKAEVSSIEIHSLIKNFPLVNRRQIV